LLSRKVLSSNKKYSEKIIIGKLKIF